MFSKGQKVLCIKDDGHLLEKGKVYTIKDKNDTFVYLQEIVFSGPSGFYPSRFVAYEVPSENPVTFALFKIGAKVRCINVDGPSGSQLKLNGIYTIRSIDVIKKGVDGTYVLLSEIPGSTWFFASRFALDGVIAPGADFDRILDLE